MALDSEDFTIDLRRLRLLREVERRGTVSATAAALHLTPSAVSQQLAGLARELDVPLLERQGRGVRLTGQARVLLAHADAVAAQLEKARADLARFEDGLVGEVRVGSLASAIAALVGPALRALRRQRPGLRLLVREREPLQAVAGLDTGQLDVVVTVEHRGGPAHEDARYDRVDLLRDVLDVLLPADHPLAGEGEVPLAALAREEWVAASADDACAQITTAACAAAGFSPDVRHHCTEFDAVAALVAAGAGVALVPRLAHPLRPAGLAVVPLAGQAPARSIYVATRAGRTAGAPTAAVVQELRRVAAERPDAVLALAAGA